MDAGQFAREVEPQSGAGDVTVLRSHQPAEPREQTMHLLRRDAETVIDDSDARDTATRGCVAADLAATRRELDRVVEEISDDRLDPSGVNIHEHRATRQASVEAVTAGDLRLNRRGRGSDDGGQALWLTFDTGDALLEARGLEHLIDELIHVVELA